MLDRSRTEFPLVCVCIPTYNSAKTVRDTLESILAQTYPNLVVYVSDNASTDDTLKVIESISDPRLFIHRNIENIGAEGNFNRCIQVATGKYAAIFHADDIYEQEMIEMQVSYLEKYQNAGAVFTAANLINEEGSRIGNIQLPQALEHIQGPYDFATMFKAVLLHSNFFVCPSFMVRTDIYQNEIIHWNGASFGTSADLDVWLRILKRHSIGHIGKALINYRISNAQWSARTRKDIARADFFLVLDYYLSQNEVKDLLDKSDLENYARLEQRDKVMRAINLYLLNNKESSLKLLSDIFSWPVVKSALMTKRGLAVFVAGACLRIFLLLGLNKLGCALFRHLKRLMRK